MVDLTNPFLWCLTVLCIADPPNSDQNFFNFAGTVRPKPTPSPRSTPFSSLNLLLFHLTFSLVDLRSIFLSSSFFVPFLFLSNTQPSLSFVFENTLLPPKSWPSTNCAPPRDTPSANLFFSKPSLIYFRFTSQRTTFRIFLRLFDLRSVTLFVPEYPSPFAEYDTTTHHQAEKTTD